MPINAATSDLTIQAIRKSPKLFQWGTVVQIHEIGSYSIVEALREHQWPERKGESTQYHIFVDGEDTSTHCPSLDSALIHAMAYKRLDYGSAGFMAQAAEKILNIE